VAGVPVWIDDRARMAHAKTIVIDGAVTLTGSCNWTRGAAANSEDLNLISSWAVAAAYLRALAAAPRGLSALRCARGLVPGLFGGSPLMRGRRPPFPAANGRAPPLSLLVPEASADGLRHLAREYRAGTG
jgi:phosphatidylserine/phosphatidylglycerophosphate/cardiolipin synthase-like enzyme